MGSEGQLTAFTGALELPTTERLTNCFEDKKRQQDGYSQREDERA